MAAIPVMRRTATLATALFALIGQQVQAQQQWWFDVEVILFKRNDVQLQEAFDVQKTEALTARLNDAPNLLSEALYPNLQLVRDSLPYCHQDPSPLADLHPIPAIQEWIREHRQAKLAAPGLGLQTPLSERDHQNANNWGFADSSNEVDSARSDTQTSFNELDDIETATNDMATSQLTEDDFTLGDAVQESTDHLFSQLEDSKRPIHAPSLRDEQWKYSISLPVSLGCVYRDEQALFSLPLDADWNTHEILAEIPRRLNLGNQPHRLQPYVFPDTELKLQTLARDLARQKGVSPLLHFGWRQEVEFGRDNAHFLRLYAGQDLSQQEEDSGEQNKAVGALIQPLSSQFDDSLIAKVRSILAGEAVATNPGLSIDEVTNRVDDSIGPKYELDGLFKVYLQYINRVPYLHIDSEMLFRRLAITPVDDQLLEPEIETYGFQQLRRIISKQIHYFDHPMFGMVVQLRRFYPPVRAEPSEEVEDS